MLKSFFVFVFSVLLSFGCSAEESQFVSMARLLVGGAGVRLIPDTFYGTNIELIRSAQISRGARNRVHSLHPDLNPVSSEVEAGRLPGTDIIVLRATGPEREYVKAFLDSVIDEFLAFRRELMTEREELDGGKAINALSDELVRLEKEMVLTEQELKTVEKSGAAPIALTVRLNQKKMTHDRLVETLRGVYSRQQSQQGGEIVSILDRASSAIAVKPGAALPNLAK